MPRQPPVPMARLPLFVALLTLAACAEAPVEAPSAGAPPSEARSEAVGSAPRLGEAPTPGATAPAFTLVDTEGAEHTLADYRGRVVVLEWLNYDCPYVGKHYGGGAMQALQAEAIAAGAVWLSVVSSAPGEQGYFEPAAMNARTEAEGGRQSAVLLDPTGTVGRRYGAKTSPHMFVVDAAGQAVYNGAIDDRPTTDPADLDGATNYVAAALDAARAGRPADPATTPPDGCSGKYADGA